MSESERVERAAELLERLLVDADFRARFRAQPEAACREAGLHDLADEIALGGGALQTLEVRESRSSLLGVMMAAALEGMGVIELSHLAGTGLTGEAAHVADIASSRAGGPRLHGPHVPHVAAPHLPHAPHVPHAPHLPHAPHVPQAPAAGAAVAAAQAPPGAGAPPAAGADPAAAAAPGAGPAGAAGAPAAAAAAVPSGPAGAAAADPAAATGGPAAAGAGASAPAGPPPGPPGALSGVPAASADSGWPDAPGAPAGTDQAGWGQAAAAGGQDAAGWPAAGAGPQAVAAGAAAADPSAAGAGAGAGAALDPSAAAGVPAPAAAAAAVAGAPAAAPDAGGALQQLVDQHRLDLPPGVQPAAFAGSVDPRLLSSLETLAGGHRLGLKVVDGQGIDITTVDGLPVGPDNPGARDLMSEIAALDPSQRPSRVGGPWAVSAPGFFSDPAHQDHIHLGFDGAARGTIQFSAVADSSQQAGTPSAPAAGAQAAPSAPAGGAVDAGQPPAGAAAVVDAAPAGGGGGFDLSSAAGDYPGDHASKAQIAHWMGEWAQRAGLPRELPVMASLVEGGMSNVQYGDADSLGYFQMRTSIWSGQYPDFQHHPEQQLKWFIDHALEVKKQRLGQGQSAFEHDPNQWGNWIADIERPAAQYRGRYQLRLAEARSLLGQAGAPAGSGPPVAAAAAAAPQPIQPPAQPPVAPVQPAQVPVTPAAPDGAAGSGPPGTISFTAAPQGGAAAGTPAPPGQAAAGAPAAPGQLADQAAAGAVAGAPAAGPQLVAGQDITVPGTASNELRQIFERAAILDHRHLPYLWGGGHQGGVGNVATTGPVDCSGAVSEVLGIDTRVSGAFENWGLPGPGKSVTVYANAEHVLMEINGHFFGTSASNPGGGAGWIPREHIPPSYLAAFVARHPPGL